MIGRQSLIWFLALVFSSSNTASMQSVGAQEPMAASQSVNQEASSSASANSAAVAESQSSTPHVLLKGTVSNRDHLAPVDAQYRTGAHLDVANVGKLKTLSPNNHWDRIPDWSAGSWAKKTSTTFYEYTYGLKAQNFSVETGMARSSEQRGWQKDRAGNIWEYSYQNYYTKTECEDIWSIGFVKDTEMMEVTPAKIIMRFVGIKVAVDKYDKTILRTVQTESIQTYTPYADRIVKIVSSIKTFDEDGNPLQLSKVLALEQRRIPFTPINDYRGHDMRKLFAEYLSSQGMASLVPGTQDFNLKSSKK